MKKELRNKIILFVFFIVLACFRLHNALTFNTYWGYDGGAHLEYIKTIYETSSMPDWEENYLAWHEPGFYYTYAVVGWVLGPTVSFADLVKVWQIVSAILSLVLVWLIYLVSKHFTKSFWARLASVVTAGFLSVVTETSNYLTNELALAVILMLVIYLVIKFAKSGFDWKKIIYLSVILGLAMLVKMSAAILVLTLLVWLLWRVVYYKKIKWFYYTIVMLVVVCIVYSPWAIYKQKNIGSIWSVNAYEDRIDEERELVSGFFSRVDGEIFNNPFWSSGSMSFYSMLYADAFSDYYMVSNNLDKNNLEVADNKKVMTGSGNFVTYTKYNWSILLMYLSLPILLVGILGVLILLMEWVKTKCKPTVNLFVLIFLAGSFAAVIFNVVNFPFLERGTLKASFILAAWPLLFVIGWSWLGVILRKYKLNLVWIGVWAWIILWATVSAGINWI